MLTPSLPEVAEVRPCIKDMEEYLSTLWSELEATAETADASFSIESLHVLTKFVVHPDTGVSSFSDFKRPYETARRQLIAVLAEKRISAP